MSPEWSIIMTQASLAPRLFQCVLLIASMFSLIFATGRYSFKFLFNLSALCKIADHLYRLVVPKNTALKAKQQTKQHTFH